MEMTLPMSRYMVLLGSREAMAAARQSKAHLTSFFPSASTLPTMKVWREGGREGGSDENGRKRRRHVGKFPIRGMSPSILATMQG